MHILTKGPEKEVSCGACLSLNDLYPSALSNWMLNLGQSPCIQPSSSWHTLSRSLHIMGNTPVFMGSATNFFMLVPQRLQGF